MRRLLALFTAAAALALSACEVNWGERPGVTRLVYASPYAPTHPFSVADAAWMKWVEEKSGGRIDIVPAWNASLISSGESMIELRHGIADIGLITPIYTRGGTHLLRAQSGFYGGVTTMPGQLVLYKCLAAEFPQIDEETKGLHILAVQGGALPGVITRNKPVKSLADFKGMRIRAPSELLPLLRRLGADPVDMPMSEVYSALAKGVIDGLIAAPDTLKTLHFSEVARYYGKLVVARGAYPARAMAKDVWDRLSPEDQALLTESSAVWEAALESNVMGSLETGAEFGRKAGVVFTPFTAAEQAAWDKAYNEEALGAARNLKHFGIDGEPVFRRAQAISRELAEGRTPACATPAKT